MTKQNITKTLTVVSALLFLFIVGYSTVHAATIYVPDDHQKIQDAVDAAATGDTVVVKDGIYTGEGNKNLDFKGKAITVKSENGPENTIIDCEDNGRGFIFQSGETTSSVLDGFTIKNGNENKGGAIYIAYTSPNSPIITNCIFLNNYATSGGGAIYLGLDKTSAKPVISNCSFSKNISSSSGGSIYIDMEGTGDGFFIIANCSFGRNAGLYGGAIYVSGFISEDDQSVIRDSTFFNNIAEDGGAIAYWTWGVVTKCAFSNNTAHKGGAIYTYGGEITNSTFWNNTALTDGGAIFTSLNNSRPSAISQCTFSKNEALRTGGAVTIDNAIGNMTGKGHLDIVNSILWGNRAGEQADQIILLHSSNLTVSHTNIEGGINAISGSEVKSLGGNIDLNPQFALSEDFHLMPDSPCIDAGINSPEQPITDTDLDGIARPLDGNTDGLKVADMGAYEFDPKDFFAAAVSPPDRFDFIAREGGALPESQTLFIRSRGLGTLKWIVSEEIPWLRLYPAEGSSTDEPDAVTLYVDHSGLGYGIYTGNLVIMNSEASRIYRTVKVTLYVTVELHVPSSIYPTIQSAIDAAIDGDVVVVADGTYKGEGNKNLNFYGKDITVKSANGPDHTVIDCENNGRGFCFDRGETSASVVQGFTIKQGSQNRGGGIYVNDMSSPTILDCIFLDNKSYYSGGGGIYLGGSRAIVINCVFDKNRTEENGDGGGIFVKGSHNTVDNCVFSGNSSDKGGGIYCQGGFFTVSNSEFTINDADKGGGIYSNSTTTPVSIVGCRFMQNDATVGGGGGACVSGSPARVTNCVFFENTAISEGYGLQIEAGYGEVTNSTFANNDHENSGWAGIAVSVSASATVTNGILWQTPLEGEDVVVLKPGSGKGLTVSYSVISYSTNWSADPVKHISNDDPLFINISSNDFRLDPSSPCIDAGTTIPWLFSDLRGSIRPIDGDKEGYPEFDIGAFEYSEYYGGLPGDLTAKAFKDLGINGSLVVTGFEYQIDWMDREPFPFDPRIRHADQYDVNLALVNEHGLRIDLDTYTFWVTQQGYTVKYLFEPEHIGTWCIRLELTSDPNQFVLSDEISIEYKKATRYALSQWIKPPEGADPNVKPDIAEEDVCYWSVQTKRLYAIAPITTVVTWFTDEQRERPLPTVAYITYPDKENYSDDPETLIHIADSMPVDLLPTGTPFDLAQKMYAENDATISANKFMASEEGWSVLLYRDDQANGPDEKEKFDVVRTFKWDHKDDNSEKDPDFPIEMQWNIGQKVVDACPAGDNDCKVIHEGTDTPILPDPDTGDNDCKVIHEDSCGSGYIFFEGAYYDGYGENKAYDRETRQGPIFAVNEDDPDTIEDDLVVVWYKTSSTSGVCWPSKPVWYVCKWPDDDAQKIVIASQLGSGPLDPAKYGAMENMLVYNQPDPGIVGHNPNEEHAAFFTAQGSEYPGVFALRTDLNNTDRTDTLRPYTSEPYAMLKYRDPLNDEWNFKVYKVVAQSESYIVKSGHVVPNDGSDTRYYIDENGNIVEWSGYLPDISYYIDADGHLVNPADTVETCYNYSGGSVSEVACLPADGVKVHYIDENGQLQAIEGSLPTLSYYLDVHGVLVESDVYYRFHYTGVAGQEINPPYPLNQLTFGPCVESYIRPGYEDSVLKDKDNKFFAIHGGIKDKPTVDIVLKYFYRLQTGFIYDLNADGFPDETVGTPIPWLEGLDGTLDDEIPVNTTYAISWPEPVPSLYVGETLTDAKTQKGEILGLPNVADQCIVQMLFDQSIAEGGDPSAKLIDPLAEHSVSFPLDDPETELPDALKPERGSNDRWVFKALPYHLQARLTYDPIAGDRGELKLKGIYKTGTGEPLLLLNTLTERDIMEIARPFLSDPNNLDPKDPSVISTIPQPLRSALYTLKSASNAALQGSSMIKFAEMKALTAGDAHGERLETNYAGKQSGYYVTLAFNNDPDDCPGPVTLSVIKVDCPLYRGEIKVIESDDAFEEKVTLRHNGDFGGNSDSKWFQWKYLSADFSGIPAGPDNPGENWKDYFAVLQVPGTDEPGSRTTGFLEDMDQGLNPDLDPTGQVYKGAIDVIVQGTGQQLLPDKWFSVRYYYDGICDELSRWTEPQLYEGWLKRVMKNINLFDLKVKDFHENEVNTLASMISLAGTRHEGSVALSAEPDNLNNLGIIEVYGTLLDRAAGLTIDQGVDLQDSNKAVLFAANRLADLYMLLGNNAYADATDPTIGFSTEDGQYGTEAPSIFCFQNQVDSLLEEELVLLRGRNDNGVQPFYNRLIWNFTLGDGEVAYKESYNITDQNEDGEVNERDAMIQFPQGHGDAWGHYLTAIKYYYDLLIHPHFTWVPQSEAILIEQTPVEVDYRDERKFAVAAAAKARTGSEIMNLTYRQNYVEDPEGQWQGYKDLDPVRAWGVDGWSRRAGQGAFFDWVVGNAILPPDSDGETPVVEQQFAGLGQVEFTLEDLLYRTGTTYLEVFVNDVKKNFDTDFTISSDPVTYKTVVTFHQGLNAEAEALFKLYKLVEGIRKIDRTTVLELREIASNYAAVQAEVDKADVGLNPLGLAKDAVPFDIDPGGIANGQTHFEQIYDRAVQAMNNAIVVFNHANRSTNLIRRQQDTLADFKRNIDNSEADFNNRLIEVFGYPYPDDCGPGKTYSTEYSKTGPDLYHFMYVEPSELMGVSVPRVHEFEVTFKNIDVDAAGALQEEEQEVLFHVATDSRFGLIKPPEWQGRRKAPGEIQLARSDLLQTRGRFENALNEYDNLLGHIEKQADLIEAQHDLNADEIYILNTAKGKQEDLNSAIKGARYKQLLYRGIAKNALVLSNALAEALPKTTGTIVGMAVGIIVDLFSSVRSAIKTIGVVTSEIMYAMADSESLTELDHQHAKEIVSAQSNIELTALRGGFAIEQQLLQLENLVRSEANKRQEIYTLAESLQQSAGRYLAGLAKGDRLLDDRLRFRKQTASQIQDYRYKDMTFRIFRNDALQKYRAQFDMAAMYVYLAAKAYDYETTLLDYNSMAGQAFLTDIVRQRTIGLIEGGQPLTGSGLADSMKRMWQNFQVLKPQLGFNNPQEETNRFSLRRELFRILMDEGSNDTWREVLEANRVDDLWDIPEFRRYCRPFAEDGIPQPGIVIPFSTTVTSGLNFFKWPLGGGDSYYSATNFATKVRSAGVWLSNYNSVELAQTPRIYLIPAGEDVLRTPSYYTKDIRTWHVVDQKLPVPFPIVETDLENNHGWIPRVDTIFDEMFQIRRHSDFRAYHDSGYVNDSEMTFDSRLIGRSVWNTHWLLIIPGQNLLYDAEEGIERFINGPEVIGGDGERTGNGVSDIKIFFHTYAYSGS